MDDLNPYESLTGDQQPGGHAGTSNRFRWRTIPVAICFGLGGIWLLTGISALVLLAYAAWTETSLPAQFSKDIFTMLLLGLIGGVALLTSAVLFAKGRWRIGLAIAVFVIAAVFLADAAGMFPVE